MRLQAAFIPTAVAFSVLSACSAAESEPPTSQTQIPVTTSPTSPATETQPQETPDAPDAEHNGKPTAPVHNDHGMFTVKCQVSKTESDHGIVGYVYGNHKTSIPIAEQDAEQYVPKFGPGTEKQNCSTIEKYVPSGAYDLHDQVF
ncbi:hypothetical protein [Corynebacterium pseudodiphtheriticum]|uniref:hypothetical protein n=1 Tax=Corynebacterium pseudodiphtheriticum TaxID=37637 RepID=UPI002543DC27|nr:hypothetical protein [Corynebacterium pseudodiphtheriticum]MDK4206905.1 hypothetical protein [Corynebacterium pseudodiphtheriticum]MDK4243609.1 hypothetical protein [Corynebacterium pseudodiphtheriticum]MDK4277854.1 hypothetical protein [Corynebacterium pseudodiphtheriticum]MDK4283705.1 hypothetical protein [Corynebacterium pseudodiphtheriticum]MDK4296463.1 hypothetical protein [Corynebacterium pseudodiphtheriticum]